VRAVSDWRDLPPTPTELRIAQSLAEFAITAKYPAREWAVLSRAALATARAEVGIEPSNIRVLHPATPLAVFARPDAFAPPAGSNRAVREMAYLAQETARRFPLSQVRATSEMVAEAAAHAVDIATPEQIANAQAVFLDGATDEQKALARAAFEARHR
jgi:hypothetical protein